MDGATQLPGMRFSQDWFTPHIPHLSRLLAPWKGRPEVRFLEVGSFEGLSTVWFLQNFLTGDGSGITCIDTFEGSEEHITRGLSAEDLQQRFLANTAAYAHRVEAVVGQSGVVLRAMAPRETYDFVYIDGSHRAPDVLEDAVLSWRLLKSGGLMVFDDYLWRLMPSRPGPAIDAFLEVQAGALEVLHREYQVAVRKSVPGRSARHLD